MGVIDKDGRRIHYSETRKWVKFDSFQRVLSKPSMFHYEINRNLEPENWSFCLLVAEIELKTRCASFYFIGISKFCFQGYFLVNHVRFICLESTQRVPMASTIFWDFLHILFQTFGTFKKIQTTFWMMVQFLNPIAELEENRSIVPETLGKFYATLFVAKLGLFWYYVC